MGCYTSPKRKREGSRALSLALRASVNSQSERTTREKPFGAEHQTEFGRSEVKNKMLRFPRGATGRPPSYHPPCHPTVLRRPASALSVVRRAVGFECGNEHWPTAGCPWDGTEHSLTAVCQWHPPVTSQSERQHSQQPFGARDRKSFLFREEYVSFAERTTTRRPSCVPLP